MTFDIEQLDQQNQPVALSTAIAAGGVFVTAAGLGYNFVSDLMN